MITFEKLVEREKAGQLGIIRNVKNKINNADNIPPVVQGYNQAIEDCEANLENIEEYTTIELGRITNSIIKVIQEEYKKNINSYYNNFENFIQNFETRMQLSAVGGAIIEITLDDLLCFKGKDPTLPETSDLFRQKINSQFNVNIPISSVEKNVTEELHQAELTGDEQEIAKAQVKFFDMQRASGKRGITATDEAYQQAKENSSERRI